MVDVMLMDSGKPGERGSVYSQYVRSVGQDVSPW